MYRASSFLLYILDTHTHFLFNFISLWFLAFIYWFEIISMRWNLFVNLLWLCGCVAAWLHNTHQFCCFLAIFRMDCYKKSKWRFLIDYYYFYACTQPTTYLLRCIGYSHTVSVQVYGIGTAHITCVSSSKYIIKNEQCSHILYVHRTRRIVGWAMSWPNCDLYNYYVVLYLVWPVSSSCTL